MLGGGSKCPRTRGGGKRCKKTVYFAERATGPGGDWHKSCLVCLDCKKRLDSTNLAEREGEAYCKACYGKNFGPRGFGFAMGGSIMHTGVSSSADAVNKSPASAAVASPSSPPTSPSSGTNFCPSCGGRAQGATFCPQCGQKLM